ncbi:MAG: succinate--CoA ligase subunit alpha [Puniceicoccales bacterium]|jgi:succinyl-CoA synthetase alpha subunit|nr:succinate--CoA ligase subunit alpha [Puniceicoccales bacterium]
MAILIDCNTNVLVHGISGRAAAFHLPYCEAYGTKVVAGVRPGKGGQHYDNRIPIYDTVREAVVQHRIHASLILVPAPCAADSILEAIEGEIPLIICISEGVPTRDMLLVRERLKNSSSLLLGPNCSGIITPGQAKLGIMPNYIHLPGRVGVVSRSGTLTFETVWQLTSRGIGQSTCVGIGGDPVHGLSQLDVIKMFEKDPQTSAMIMVGEIGGEEEEEAAEFIHHYGKKPVAAYIAGVTAPEGKRMGHAGAIIAGKKSGAIHKIRTLEKHGIAVARDPSRIAEALLEICGSQCLRGNH